MHPADALSCKLHRPNLASGTSSLTLKEVRRTQGWTDQDESFATTEGRSTVTRVPPFGRPLARAHVDTSTKAQRQPVGWLLAHHLISSRRVAGQVAP